jgi:hypothetical protein
MPRRRMIRIVTIVIVALVAAAFLANRALPEPLSSGLDPGIATDFVWQGIP